MRAAVLHGLQSIAIEDRPVPDLRPGMVLIRVRRAGICGSDLHYFEHGRVGAFVPTQPFILGHEFMGEIAALGEGVTELNVGDRVTANPARACGFCDYCKGGRGNLCRKTIMLGSASTDPPTDGVFADYVAVRADQIHILPDEMDDATGAMLEPFAVALHAVKRAGGVSGKRVLVTGGGPIGLLVALVARQFGATPVAVSDIVESRRRLASTFAADETLDPSLPTEPQAFDVIFEASGAQTALRQAFDLVRPGGTIVQIGTHRPEDIPLPVNLLMSREINLIGSMRYGNVFEEAIRLISTRQIDLHPLITTILPFAEVDAALRLAGDKNASLKVHLEMD